MGDVDVKYMTFDVKYEAGHTYRETWTHNKDIHCPACGKRTIWTEQSDGDYYQGPSSICISPGCGATFTMPSFSILQSNEDKQRLDALRAAG
jgi:hypothetical protein